MVLWYESTTLDKISRTKCREFLAEYNKRGIAAADPIHCNKSNVICDGNNNKQNKRGGDRCWIPKKTPPSPLLMKKGGK